MAKKDKRERRGGGGGNRNRIRLWEIQEPYVCTRSTVDRMYVCIHPQCPRCMCVRTSPMQCNDRRYVCIHAQRPGSYVCCMPSDTGTVSRPSVCTRGDASVCVSFSRECRSLSCALILAKNLRALWIDNEIVGAKILSWEILGPGAVADSSSVDRRTQDREEKVEEEEEEEEVVVEVFSGVCQEQGGRKYAAEGGGGKKKKRKKKKYATITTSHNLFYYCCTLDLTPLFPPSFVFLHHHGMLQLERIWRRYPPACNSKKW